MPFFAQVLTLTLVAVQGPVQNPNLPRAKGLKVYHSKHLAIYFSGDLQPLAAPLGKAGDRFLADLERQWSLILPKERIRVSLGTQPFSHETWSHIGGADWLLSRYDTRYRRIDLRIVRPSQYRAGPLAEALEHQLIHHLLRLKRLRPLPEFIEEGIAQHYGRAHRGRDRYLAIWAIHRADSVQKFLTSDKTFQTRGDFFYGAALGRFYILWLLEQKPQGEKRFLQALVSGRSLESAYFRAGFRDSDLLLTRFEQEISQKLKLHTMLYTIDFWLIAGGILALFAMARKVRQAYLTGRSAFTAIEAIGSPEVAPELFTGPAFGGVGTGSKPVRAEEEAEEIDFDESVERVFSDFMGTDSAPKAREPSPAGWNRDEKSSREVRVPGTLPSSKPVPLPPEFGTKEDASLEELEALDDDLDRVFDDWRGRELPPKHGATEKSEDLGQNLDQVFAKLERKAPSPRRGRSRKKK